MPLASATRFPANLRHLTAMNAQELFKALSVIAEIPLGAKEQLVFAAIATETDGTGFDALLVRIGGNAPALRQLLDRLKSKGVIETSRDASDARVYKLSSEGKKILKKITK